ncbi:MAG: GNAT family N-acetyltransferase [Acidobacteriia bacterium]|nr:GNAT family N-acetyltransferase [Terriglobia bacterium]
MDPTLRLAAESDADLLLEFMREYYAFDGHHFDLSKARAALLGLLRDPSLGRVWLISTGQEVAGYVVLTLGYSLEFLGRDAFLDEFYLRENHRGQGLGRKVLELVEEAARSLHVRALHLEAVRRNQAAQHFYRKLGFKDREHYLMTKWIDRTKRKSGH